MINVTKKLNDSNKNIEKFFLKVKKNKWSILKTVREVNNDTMITLYVFDDEILNIRVWNYFIKAQNSDIYDARFNKAYTIQNESIVNIYLKGNKVNAPDSSEFYSDLFVYSYII